MSEKKSSSPEAIRAKVDQVLKTTIDSELVRASSPQVVISAEGSPFSRGVIFSKTNPFSRGIFFSRQSGFEERPNELEQEVAMDPLILNALAERLIQVRAVKDLKVDSLIGHCRGRIIMGLVLSSLGSLGCEQCALDLICTLTIAVGCILISSLAVFAASFS
jgi:hypothetical protein